MFGFALLVLGSAVWFWLFVAPKHWLSRVDFGTVKLDEQVVPADFYIGNPNGSEAEAVVLVHLKDEGDYFLDLGSEKVRQGSPQEYVRILGGIWCFKSIPNGTFSNPLPFRNINEFRISAPDRRIVSIQL